MNIRSTSYNNTCVKELRWEWLIASSSTSLDPRPSFRFYNGLPNRYKTENSAWDHVCSHLGGIALTDIRSVFLITLIIITFYRVYSVNGLPSVTCKGGKV